jgi:nucleoside-diphosphate-sugar epimerase
MEKVLITGSSGFIGGYLVEEAIAQGFEVYASVRANSNKHYLKNPNIKFLELDFENEEHLNEILNECKFDHVIHNAGTLKEKNQAAYDKINADYSIRLAKSALSANPSLKTFVFMSSLASTGPADFQPNGIILNDLTPHPVTKYGISKLKAETSLKSMENLPYVFFRPTAVYGPREKDLFTVFKMISKGFEVGIGHQPQYLTFIFVKDLAKLVVNSLTIGGKRKAYFMSDGNVYSKTDLGEAIKKVLDKKTIKFNLPLWLVNIIAIILESIGNISGKYPIINRDKINELKALNWQCDSHTAFKELGYLPQTDLWKGAAITAEWYKENKWI